MKEAASIEILVYRNGAQVKETVEARIVGALAVHKGHGAYASGWTITHIASGRALLTALKRREMACLLAEDLREILDWSQPREVLLIACTDAQKEQIKDLAKRYGLFQGESFT